MRGSALGASPGLGPRVFHARFGAGDRGCNGTRLRLRPGLGTGLRAWFRPRLDLGGLGARLRARCLGLQVRSSGWRRRHRHHLLLDLRLDARLGPHLRAGLDTRLYPGDRALHRRGDFRPGLRHGNGGLAPRLDARFGARDRRQFGPRLRARLRQHSWLLAQLRTLHARNRFHRLGRRRRDLGCRLQRNGLGAGLGTRHFALRRGGGTLHEIRTLRRDRLGRRLALLGLGRGRRGLLQLRGGQLHRQRLLLGELWPQTRQEQQCQRMQHDRHRKRRHQGPLAIPGLRGAVQEQRLSGDGRHDVERTGGSRDVPARGPDLGCNVGACTGF